MASAVFLPTGRGTVYLSVPRGAAQGVGARYSPDAFSRTVEAVARFMGTGRYLAGQTVYIVAWIALNTTAVIRHWDPYPFILLNLTFSTQAAYAAPLILLAQNRQDERDRATIERDRQVAARTQADTEYLAREIAAIRLALVGAITTDNLNEAVAQAEKLITGQQAPYPEEIRG